LKVDLDGKPMYLSLEAAQFKLHGEFYTLVSIKDIQTEIDRAHLVKELEIAWDVQKSLLPGSNPAIPGFDIAADCKPAKEVGGDYYDFIVPAKDKLALIIGDVSGKGTSASFYMTLTKGYIQATIDENMTPKEILVKVNELLLNTISKKLFVTLFIALLDVKTKKVVCARAGHNPAFHFSKKKDKTVSIKPGGIALGLRKSTPFTEAITEEEIQLEKGDWLVLYTDGFTEARNAGAWEFGEDRFIQAIGENLDKCAGDMVDSMFSQVEIFTGTAGRHDDMTMVAIKVLPDDED